MKYHVISDPSGEIIFKSNSLDEARKFAKNYPHGAYVLEDAKLWS